MLFCFAKKVIKIGNPYTTFHGVFRNFFSLCRGEKVGSKTQEKGKKRFLKQKIDVVASKVCAIPETITLEVVVEICSPR